MRMDLGLGVSELMLKLLDILLIMAFLVCLAGNVGKA